MTEDKSPISEIHNFNERLNSEQDRSFDNFQKKENVDGNISNPFFKQIQSQDLIQEKGKLDA